MRSLDVPDAVAGRRGRYRRTCCSPRRRLAITTRWIPRRPRGQRNGGNGRALVDLGALGRPCLRRGPGTQPRIKIWNPATDTLVYDNQAGKSDTGDDATALGAGSIVIHDGKK